MERRPLVPEGAPVHLNLLTQCIPAPFFEGMWRHPDDRTATGYKSLRYWTSVAERLEAACIDALFFADVHGVYDTYQSSPAPAIRHSVQVPAIDPTVLIPALAAATRHLGFAVTCSTSYQAPYQCARLFSSLDHLTGGRIGWNIVTSDLRLARGTGLADHLTHEDRYDRADEYMEVVHKLWEESWEEGAVLRDAGPDAFADAGRVHSVQHQGRWFRICAPHQCEPSPQRTPVLYQAGQSDRGSTFAARHAEVVFVTLGAMRGGRQLVADLRDRAERMGRDPSRLKVLQGTGVMLGRTSDEARARADDFVRLTSPGGVLTKWCGWTGVDLAVYPDETPLSEVRGHDLHSVLGTLQQATPDREWTVGDVRTFVAVARRPNRFTRLMLFGTPVEVADRMEEWIARTGIDGFNLSPCPPSPGIDDICDLLVPELQRRGLLRKAYDPAETTLRERYFGAGNHRYA